MGCVPPERRQTSTAAAASMKKTSSLNKIINKTKSPIKKQAHLHPQSETIPPHQPQPYRNNSGHSSPKFRGNESQPIQTTVYSRRSSSPNNVMERQTIRVLAPSSSSKDLRAQQLSRLASVHSLDLNSRIKASENSTKRIIEEKRIEPLSQPQQEYVNITFNNNTFAVHNNSKATALSKGKHWRQHTLKEELRSMNDQNFRKIQIQSMNFK